jgi:hypothetical protein
MKSSEWLFDAFRLRAAVDRGELVAEEDKDRLAQGLVDLSDEDLADAIETLVRLGGELLVLENQRAMLRLARSMSN